MSRALDKSVKEALKHGDHERVFTDISQALSLQRAQLLEIELLGQSHVLDANTTLLQDDNAIAIPKIRLVQAFLFGRSVLANHRRGVQGIDDAGVLKATAVMLLMDPEHLTAANTRKRIVSNAIRHGNDVAQTLQSERYLVDSLLTSRLHRHTKSPTLYGYRKWLLDRFGAAGLATDAIDDMRTVVFISAERHPRNYYAWMHARYLIATQLANDLARQQQQLSTILADTKKWCFSHHDDVSGWAFLAILLERCPEQAVSVLNETLQRVESFHWRNESVWYFLRNMARASSGIDGIEDKFRAANAALQQGTDEDSIERRVLGRALRVMDGA